MATTLTRVLHLCFSVGNAPAGHPRGALAEKSMQGAEIPYNRSRPTERVHVARKQMRHLPGFPAVVLVCACLACQAPQRDAGRTLEISPGSVQTPSGPKRDLSRDEEHGGHTLRKHVGRTDNELRERLADEPNISAASTWTDRRTAEQVVGLALEQNQGKIDRWRSRPGRHANLVIDYDGDPSHPVGRTLQRGEGKSEPCSHAVIVLRWAGEEGYYVLTSYPECR